MSEQFVLQYIQQLQPSDRIALDIGANHGIYTIPMASKFKKIYAFEPHPQNISILEGNLKKYNIQNVEIVPKAVSNRSGTMNMTTNPHNSGGHTLSEKVASHQEWGFVNTTTLEVPTITLDEFCKDLDVEFMKIDIEGAEDFMFEGATEFLKRNSINIMLEVHNEVDRLKLFNMFKSFEFDVGSLGLLITSEGIRQALTPVNEFIADNHYLIRKP